jgi:hypothetical protein
MWHQTFEQRLADWNQLRIQSLSCPLDQALGQINTWWFRAPWTPYHLHWDDQPTWPSPWQLLDDNLFCPLARGLGILYTITLLDRQDLQDAVLVDITNDNLVLVDQKKYILNWDKDQIVNINLAPGKSRHSVSLEQIKKQIK